MTEQQLCKNIHEALFQNGSCKANKWFTVKLEDGDKLAVFEAIVPSKGNIKIRKPIRHVKDNLYDYNVYRITKNSTLFDMGIYTDERPEAEELIAYECLWWT